MAIQEIVDKAKELMTEKEDLEALEAIKQAEKIITDKEKEQYE